MANRFFNPNDAAMMDVLVGSIDGAFGERFSVYLRTARGRRVVSFEVSGKGNEMPDSVT